MVSIDYRLNYGVSREQIIDMFKSLRYFHIGKKKKALKKGQNWIPTEEFVKIYENGRFHIFVEFSSKSSGTEPYPQVDVHAHYDYFKKKGEKELHITRRNIRKDLKEMYDIHDALKDHNYGYMEYKSRNSTHDTIKNNHLKFLVKVLKKDYKYDQDGKYKKKLPNGQITFQIIEQRRYSHVVCVYAIGEKHELYRDKALEELNRIMDILYETINNAREKCKELRQQLKESEPKLNHLRELRNSKNLKTKELILSIKELENDINECSNSKKKKTLGYRKKKVERKLIKNKKSANDAHKDYVECKKEVKKVKRKIKKYKG